MSAQPEHFENPQTEPTIPRPYMVVEPDAPAYIVEAVQAYEEAIYANPVLLSAISEDKPSTAQRMREDLASKEFGQYYNFDEETEAAILADKVIVHLKELQSPVNGRKPNPDKAEALSAERRRARVALFIARVRTYQGIDEIDPGIPASS